MFLRRHLCFVIPVAGVLLASAPPTVGQAPTLIDVQMQQSDNPEHVPNDRNAIFPQAGGLTWDGLVRIQPLQVDDPSQDRFWFGFHAMVVRYGDFERDGDQIDFVHSNATYQTFVPFQYLRPGSGWVTDYVYFKVGSNPVSPYLTQAQVNDWVAEPTDQAEVDVVLNTETNMDQHRLVSLVPDALGLEGNPLTQNPYPSDADGVPVTSGSYAHMTYCFVLLSGQVEPPDADQPWGARNLLGTRRGYIVVSLDEVSGESKRFPAAVVKARFLEAMKPLLIDQNDPMYGFDAANDGSYSGSFRAIEASTDLALNLVVAFGNIENDGKLENIVFSVRKPQTDGSSLWTAPRNLSVLCDQFGDLVFGQSNSFLSGYAGTPLADQGIRFGERYKLADLPLAHHDGTPFDDQVVEESLIVGERVLGDYPWMLLDGEMVTFQTTRGLDLIEAGSSVWNCANWAKWFGARRGTMITLGESTESQGTYRMRVNDFPNGEHFFTYMTTNSTASGRFDDAWDPSKHLPASQAFTGIRPDFSALGLYAAPSKPHRDELFEDRVTPPTLSHFHGQKWSEVSYRDREDGEYVVYSSLHPLPYLAEEFDAPCVSIQLPADYLIDFTKAQESSGHGRSVLLQEDAYYPRDYHLDFGGGELDLDRDRAEGKVGQGVFLLASGKIVVPNGSHSAFDDIDDEATVEFFLKPSSVPSSGNPVRLVDSSPFKVEMGTNRKLRVTLYTGSSLPQTHTTGYVGSALPLDQWSHVAATFQVNVNGGSQSVTKLYVDGALVTTLASTGTQFYRGGASGLKDLAFGPGGSVSSCLLVMDEVALSRVARAPDELEVSSARRPELPSEVSYGRSLPLGITDYDLFVPQGKAFDADLVDLGRHLFFDGHLSDSASNDFSCASCHVPAKGFSDDLPLARNYEDVELDRRTPNITNLAVAGPDARFRWDGDSTTLEQQMSRPFFGEEMGVDGLADLRYKLNQRWATYEGLFVAAFGGTFDSVNDVQLSHVEAALAAFVRDLIAGNAPFDGFRSGNAASMTAQQKHGWSLFSGKARCIACHSGAAFTDGEFYNTIVDVDASGADLLRYESSQRTRDKGAAKTPGLRNVGMQVKYTHDGNAFATLEDLLEAYSRGGPDGSDVHIKVRPVALSDDEITALADFIENGLATIGTSNNPFAVDDPWN